MTVVKTSHRKIKPKIKHYRDYEGFFNDILMELLYQTFPQSLENNFDKVVGNFPPSCNKILDQ